MTGRQVADKKFIGIYAIGNTKEKVNFFASSYDKAEVGFKAYCRDNGLQYIGLLDCADKRQEGGKFNGIYGDG